MRRIELDRDTVVRGTLAILLVAIVGVGFIASYVAVGWVVAGYLGATLLGLGFGTRPGLAHVGWRLAALAALGVLVGIGGALTGRAIGGFGGSWLGTGAVGALTVFAVGATTVALQAIMGVLGTGVAILIFVVLGNPSSGGPFATELLPGPWRAVGPLIPTSAAVTSVRDLAYFPHASLMGPLLVLVAWGAAGAAVAGLVGGRRTERSEAEGSMAAAAAP